MTLQCLSVKRNGIILFKKEIMLWFKTMKRIRFKKFK
jgi:hypothetical protein